MSSRIAERRAGACALAALLAAGALGGCKPAAPAVTPAPPAMPLAWTELDPNELLTPESGAVVSDRSGESNYETCALFVLDGSRGSYWMAPPGDPEQWLVIDLPALSRVTKVGASTVKAGSGPPPPQKLRFEGSRDGKTYSELRTVDITRATEPLLFDVPPTEIRSVRVSMLKTPDGPSTPSLHELHLRGEELEPVSAPRFSGHWSLDGRPLDIAQHGNVVYAVADMKPPMVFYGVADGRTARLTWVRGKETGVAWLSVNPSSTRLSGIWWWLDPLMNLTLGQAWYGERLHDAPDFAIDVPPMADVFLGKLGRFPLYGFLFRPDGELDPEASRDAIAFIQRALQAFPTYRVRLEVLEGGSWEESKNLQIAAERGKRLEAALVREGIPADRLLIEARSRTDQNVALQRFIYSRVDFSLAGK